MFSERRQWGGGPRRRCYTEENWRRLQALCVRFDPDGVFRTWLDGVPAR